MARDAQVGRNLASGLAGAGVTAGLMFWFDSARGARRRARVRDTLVHAAHVSRDGLRKAGTDAAHRAKGLLARARAAARPERADDETVEERVRAALGRLSSHPSAIEVTAHDGVVRLDGPVLQRDWHQVIHGVMRVRGVSAVEDRLIAHREPGLVPGLQGETLPRRNVLTRSWAPAPRILAGVMGAVLAAAGFARRGPARAALVSTGVSLFARSAANRPLARWLRRRRERRVLDFVRDIEIAAPVSAVFSFWTTLENLPRFMGPVTGVRRLDGRRSRWTAEGPSGRFEWDVEITQYQRNGVIAWRSADDSVVPHTGTVRFEPDGQGGTRVQLRLCYDPDGSEEAQAFLRLWGRDPAQQVEDDLVKLKALMESDREQDVKRET
jgi:uncharacterized membrane protein